MESETKVCKAVYHGGKDIPIDGIRAWTLETWWKRRCRWTFVQRDAQDTPNGCMAWGGSRDRLQNPLIGSKTRRGAPPHVAGGVVAQWHDCRVTWMFEASKLRGRVRRGGREVLEGSRGAHLLNKEMLSQEPMGEKSRTAPRRRQPPAIHANTAPPGHPDRSLVIPSSRQPAEYVLHKPSVAQNGAPHSSPVASTTGMTTPTTRVQHREREDDPPRCLRRGASPSSSPRRTRRPRMTRRPRRQRSARALTCTRRASARACGPAIRPSGGRGCAGVCEVEEAEAGAVRRQWAGRVSEEPRRRVNGVSSTSTPLASPLDLLRAANAQIPGPSRATNRQQRKKHTLAPRAPTGAHTRRARPRASGAPPVRLRVAAQDRQRMRLMLSSARTPARLSNGAAPKQAPIRSRTRRRGLRERQVHGGVDLVRYQRRGTAGRRGRRAECGGLRAAGATVTSSGPTCAVAATASASRGTTGEELRGDAQAEGGIERLRVSHIHDDVEWPHMRRTASVSHGANGEGKDGERGVVRAGCDGGVERLAQREVHDSGVARNCWHGRGEGGVGGVDSGVERLRKRKVHDGVGFARSTPDGEEARGGRRRARVDGDHKRLPKCHSYDGVGFTRYHRRGNANRGAGGTRREREAAPHVQSIQSVSCFAALLHASPRAPFAAGGGGCRGTRALERGRVAKSAPLAVRAAAARHAGERRVQREEAHKRGQGDSCEAASARRRPHGGGGAHLSAWSASRRAVPVLRATGMREAVEVARGEGFLRSHISLHSSVSLRDTARGARDGHGFDEEDVASVRRNVSCTRRKMRPRASEQAMGRRQRSLRADHLVPLPHPSDSIFFPSREEPPPPSDPLAHPATPRIPRSPQVVSTRLHAHRVRAAHGEQRCAVAKPRWIGGLGLEEAHATKPRRDVEGQRRRSWMKAHFRRRLAGARRGSGMVLAGGLREGRDNARRVPSYSTGAMCLPSARGSVAATARPWPTTACSCGQRCGNSDVRWGTFISVSRVVQDSAIIAQDKSTAELRLSVQAKVRRSGPKSHCH
ncbi:hypothetical protein DFH09DRAFT_1505749 [Mycena vulgaris]|nr:hypothetical protein DFH09DRAFT_1505749 [Mycena vulgaris]